MPFMQIPKTFSIFPVSGKKPLVEWGEYSKRLPNKEELNKWLGNKEWGIATGPVSKIIVLDDDGGLDVTKYPVPKTWTVKTPRGGTHYYFQWTPELNDKVTTKTEVFEKVDVRGSGGFVVFYGWQKPIYFSPLSTPPQWLIDLLPNKHSETANNNSQIANKNSELVNKSHLQELLDGIKPGNRNDSFTRAAGSLRSRGYSSNDIFSLLTPKAAEVNFSLSELKIVCDSVSRYEPSIRLEHDETQNVEDFLENQEKVEWICDGMIAKKSIAFMVGLPEARKTWAVIDLAIECAKGGGQWLGKFPIKGAKVLFVDQERFKGETQRRFKAVISAKGYSLSQLRDQLAIRCGTTTRLNLQPSFDAFRKILIETKPDLVIIDSFATIHSNEENNRKDIQIVLEKIKELRNEFGCTFLFLAHENKLAFNKEEAGEPSINQMAGSIAIPAAAETVFTVRRQDAESSMVYNTKNTLASTVEPFLLKVIDIDNTKIEVKGF